MYELILRNTHYSQTQFSVATGRLIWRLGEHDSLQCFSHSYSWVKGFANTFRAHADFLFPDVNKIFCPTPIFPHYNLFLLPSWPQLHRQLDDNHSCKWNTLLTSQLMMIWPWESTGLGADGRHDAPEASSIRTTHSMNYEFLNGISGNSVEQNCGCWHDGQTTGRNSASDFPYVQLLLRPSSLLRTSQLYSIECRTMSLRSLRCECVRFICISVFEVKRTSR